ncbi:MAG: MFS transporter [Gammaproteobacteria bacterium]|nr:MFS transporter [Gammaproteobacteria bacterium]
MKARVALTNPNADQAIRKQTPSFSFLPLYLMAIGTFAVGTEGFMIAPILPSVADDLSVPLVAAGQLVTIFALTYAISSPVLTALTGSLNRRSFLIGAMGLFALGNLIAAVVPNFISLIFARVFLAMAAGLYVPNSNAVASIMAPPEKRGRALAIINGGLTVAIVLGVPLGAFIGNHLSWRATFGFVALLAAIAVVGLMLGLPKDAGANAKVTTLRERFAVIQQYNVFPSLLVTLLWAVGAYTVYTYIAPVTTLITGWAGTEIGYVLFLWGGFAFLGLLIGGALSDRLGVHRVIDWGIPALGISLAALTLISHIHAALIAIPLFLLTMVTWAFMHWGAFPAQQARLINIAGEKHASVVLSLNASFMYLGFALGALLGTFVLVHSEVANLGIAGALAVAVSVAFYLFTKRRERSRASGGSRSEVTTRAISTCEQREREDRRTPVTDAGATDAIVLPERSSRDRWS